MEKVIHENAFELKKKKPELNLTPTIEQLGRCLEP